MSERYYVYELGFIRRDSFDNLKKLKEYYENKKNDENTIRYEIFDTEAQGKNKASWILDFTEWQFKEFIKNL